MKTFTGQKLGAGTDAKIYVEFIGERGSSDFRKLDDKLERYESGRYGNYLNNVFTAFNF